MKASLFLLGILCIVACQQTSKTQEASLTATPDIIKTDHAIPNDTIVYETDGNDLALIKLSLLPNETFNFYMQIYGDPMEESESEEDIIQANGTWRHNENKVVLHFAKREKDTLDLNALFDAHYKVGNEFTVIDDTTVELDFTLDSIHIWGVACYKK